MKDIVECLSPKQNKERIIKLINQISGKFSPYDVFSDWVHLVALSIQNTCYTIHDDVWNSREEEYLKIINKYDCDDQQKIVEMTYRLGEAMEGGITDILGEIYMESGCGNKNTGQFFTPFNISLMNAQLLIPKMYDGSETLTLNEPACGSGSMILAAAKILKDQGINFQRCLKVVCQDLDWKSVYMCYIHLSLHGIDGVVVQGDTLSEPYTDKTSRFKIFRTPKSMGVLI